MSNRNVSSWLPNLIGPIDFQADGVDTEVPRRSTINVIGITVTDDPDNDRTNLEVSAAGAAGTSGDVQVNVSGNLAGVSPGTTGNVLTSNGTAWVSSAPTGGGGSPGGNNDEVQVKNGSSFSGATGVKAFAGYMTYGSTVASMGVHRFVKNVLIAAARNSGDTGDNSLLATNGGDEGFLFCDASYVNACVNGRIYPLSNLYMGVNGGTYAGCGANKFSTYKGLNFHVLTQNNDYTISVDDTITPQTVAAKTFTMPASPANGDLYVTPNNSTGVLTIDGNGVNIAGKGGATDTLGAGESRIYVYDSSQNLWVPIAGYHPGGGSPIFGHCTSDVTAGSDPTFSDLVTITTYGTNFKLEGIASGLAGMGAVTPRIRVLIDGSEVNYCGSYGPASVASSGVQCSVLANVSLSAGSHTFKLQIAYGGSAWAVNANSNPTREGAWLCVTPLA